MQEVISEITRICSVRRNTSTESKESWARAEELCMSIGMKMCATCHKVKDFNQFHVDKNASCGYRNRCRACYGKRLREIKEESIECKLQRQSRPANAVVARIDEARSCEESTRRYETESFGNQMLLSCPGIEVIFWQDGTHSDAGIRPNGSIPGYWLPVQMKATKSTQSPFIFGYCSGYGQMLMIGVTGSLEAFIMNSSEAMKDGRIKKYWKDTRLDAAALAEVLVSKWEDALYDEGLFDEHTLRRQCSPSSKIELELMELSSSIVDRIPIQWPDVRNSSVDRILPGGLRAQDKAAYIHESKFVGSVMKKFRRNKIPYFSNDCDVFVFSKVIASMRILLEWRIPMAWLCSNGVVTVIEEGRVVKYGKNTMIALGVDESTKMAIIGTSKSTKQEIMTRRFLSIHKLPESYIVPECLL